MQWLAGVSDPEIPVLSIVDLGLIRHVAWDGDTCVVTITPTYSGCPAMQEISADIKSTLLVHGVEQVRIQTQLSPARSEEHTSELQSLMRISYAVFCLKKKNQTYLYHTHTYIINQVSN